jgi:hypothetical protein
MGGGGGGGGLHVLRLGPIVELMTGIFTKKGTSQFQTF